MCDNMLKYKRKRGIYLVMKMLSKIKIFVVMGVLFASTAHAEINEEIVERAWAKIANTDGFKVVKINYEKDDSPNAWVQFKSQDDFSVHVTRGLMKILNNEEEIAGVLGHEIGHVRCGHYNESVQRNIGWAALGALLSKAGGLASAAGSIGVNLAESGFSRGQEVEADDYGTDLLAKAGYSPWGLYNAMKCFKDNKFVTQPNGFNSHPPTDRRLKHLSDRAKSIEKNSGAVPKDTKLKESNAADSDKSKNAKPKAKYDKNKYKKDGAKGKLPKTGSRKYKK